MTDRDTEFRAFVKATYPGLRRYLANKSNAHDANDLCSEALEIFFKKDGLDHPNPRAFLYKIADFRWRNYIRKMRPTVEFESHAMVGLKMTTSVSAKTARAELLLRTLGSIPADEQRAFELHYGEGMTIAELAEVFEVSAATVKRRLQRAREGMRGLLAEPERDLDGEIAAAYLGG
jgi:RNA polymerase sigma-70 factor (ECF subfamily)